MRFPFYGNTVSNWLLIDSFVLLAICCNFGSSKNSSAIITSLLNFTLYSEDLLGW